MKTLDLAGIIPAVCLPMTEDEEMLRLVKQGEIFKAQAIWNRLAPFEAVIFGAPMRDYRPRTKEALAVLGVIPRATIRKPFLPISAAERERVRQALIQAGQL